MVRGLTPSSANPTPAVYGEAACAVVARTLGMPVICENGEIAVPAMYLKLRDLDAVTRIGAIEKLAKVMIAKLVAPGSVDPRLSAELDDDPRAGAVWTMALHVAMLKAGVGDWTPENNDEMADLYEDEANEELAELLAEVFRLCVECWPAIERTAAELLERPHLDTAELDQILNASMH